MLKVRYIGALALLAALSVAGCRAAGPGTGVALDSAGVEALAVDFSGSCQWARPAGEPSRYTVTLETVVDALVRSDAAFITGDESNVIGELPAGLVVSAEGPLEHPRYDYGVGFAVVLRGTEGRVCRGYVRASTVKVLLGGPT